MGRSRRFYVCEPRPSLGGQAEVYPATGTDGLPYAVKLARTGADGEILREEARVVTWLLEQRPELQDMVAPILDEGEHETRPFVVLPWYESRLDHHVRDRGLTERLRIGAALARAVARLHAGPGAVVHRDIKPSNAFVEEADDGTTRIVLADFGVAGARRREVVDHLTGQHTPGFGPVDQILPRRLQGLEPSWDVHAVACSVYALIASRPPDGVQRSYSALTVQGAALQRAWAQWSADPVSEARHEVARLGDLPLDQLVRLSDIEPLEPQDVLLLREHAGNAARVEGVPSSRGTRAGTALVELLRLALAPDPRQRALDAAGLADRLDALADWVRGRGAPPRFRRRRGPAIAGAALLVATALSLAPPGAPTYDAVVVEPGAVTLGSTPDAWGREDDEPLREVQITRAYAIGATEVTQRLWREVTGESPVADRRVGLDAPGSPCADYEREPLVGDEYPVVCVSWCDAVAFANALSRRDGLAPAYQIDASDDCAVRWDRDADGWRLPTEAEWAHAARSGGLHGIVAGSLQDVPERGCAELSRFGNVADAAFRARFPWLDGGLPPTGYRDRACSRDALEDDGYAGLAPVGAFEPNRFGVYDLTGNVREWVFDVYEAHPTGGVDPSGPEEGTHRVFRGSAFDDDARNVRIANRGHAEPARRMKYVGVRLARSLVEEDP